MRTLHCFTIKTATVAKKFNETCEKQVAKRELLSLLLLRACKAHRHL